MQYQVKSLLSAAGTFFLFTLASCGNSDEYALRYPVIYFDAQPAPDLLDLGICARIRLVNHLAWRTYRCKGDCSGFNKTDNVLAAEIVGIGRSHRFRTDDGLTTDTFAEPKDEAPLFPGTERVLDVRAQDGIAAISFGVTLDLDVQVAERNLFQSRQVTSELPAVLGKEVRFDCGQQITFDVYSAAAKLPALRAGQTVLDDHLEAFPDQPHLPTYWLPTDELDH